MYSKRKALSIVAIIALAIAAVPLAASAAPAAEDLQAPVVSAVAGSPSPVYVGNQLTVTATVDDATTGGSNIQSAEFSVNGGGFAALAAADGAFDTPTENVAGNTTLATVGTYEICVRGTDAAGLVSEPACTDVEAQSQIGFEGFGPPIKGQEMFVKAGRTIPVKWTLENPDGSPISLLETFQGIFSYEVDCETLEGDASLAVRESSPGNAAVRSLLSGQWIALWKTPKEYADSCRMMYVMFSDGSTSPEVLFRFR